MTRSLAFVLALVAATAAHADTVALVGARVHVKPGQTIDGATVIVTDGRITAVGVGVTAAGARTIDARGKVVTAGLIEAASAVGMVGIELEASSVDGRLPPVDTAHDDVIHAGYATRDGFDPDSVTVAVARTGGLTAVAPAPSGGVIAGQAALFTLDGAVDPQRAPAAMHAALGGDGAGAVAGSRGRALALLREALDDAASYARDRAAYERNQKRHLIADRADLEALAAVVRGAVPLIVTAHAAADIRAALRLAKATGVRLVIAGGSEAWKVAPLLAAARVPVILDPSANLPARLAASDVRDDAAAILAKAGVAVAVSTLGDPYQARTLRQLAGIAVANGLPWEQALAALTTVPAAIYGATDRGTVEVGRVADLVVWSGDPLELATVAETVFIGGVVQGAVTHQSRLLDRYRRLP